jgi:putative cardiolipin synthase
VPALLAGGCVSSATFPPRLDHELSLPPDRAQPGDLGRLEARLLAGAVDGHSGFLLLDSGEDALVTRLALCNLAERSLDIQTYIWEFDTAGEIVAQRLLAAADRGVRVRLLLDDTAGAAHDKELGALDAHPGIDVRFFNPFPRRRGDVMRIVELIYDWQRLDHRMHNKAFIADGSFAVVGGRNVADDYYLLAKGANFRDFDLLATGPVVPAVAGSFDGFWNSRYAVAFGEHGVRPGSAASLARLRGRLDTTVARQTKFPYHVTLAGAEQLSVLEALAPRFAFGRGRVLADPPTKVVADGASPVHSEIATRAAAVEHELLVEVSYFALPRDGIELLTDLAQRGVRVRVLTNSLATNDVIAAHAGYSRIRRPLLAAGVELHELRRETTPGRVHRLRLAGSSHASLHSKVVVFDRQSVFVGSLNLDRRSIDLNTEIGLFVDSPELAAQATGFIEAALAPGASWHVQLAAAPAGPLIWEGERAGQPRRIRQEPEASLWRRLLSAILARLPIQGEV